MFLNFTKEKAYANIKNYYFHSLAQIAQSEPSVHAQSNQVINLREITINLEEHAIQKELLSDSVVNCICQFMGKGTLRYSCSTSLTMLRCVSSVLLGSNMLF